MLSLHRFIALVKKELLTLSRDIHGMAALFVMPVVFIIVMSLALQDVYTPPATNLSYAVVNDDQGATAATLLLRWAQQNGAPQPLPPDWENELRSGRLEYVLIIEAGFSGLSGSPNSNTAKVRLLAEPGLNNGLFEAHRVRLAAMVAQLKTEQLLAQLPPGLNAATANIFDSQVVAERLSAGPRPTAVQQNVPAWLVFGMFFVVASIAGLFIEERSCGALARLRSLGVRPWQLIASKIGPYLLVNGLQAALMLAVGIWLMPLIGGKALSLQGVHWDAMLLILLAISLAAVSMALAVACLVTTHAQAATLGPILNVLMAALGGVMVPVFVMPPVMQQIAAYSPMNWGLEGLLNVLLRTGGVADVLPEAGKLAVFAVLMLGTAFILLRRRM